MEGLKQKDKTLFVTAYKIEVYIETYYFNNINSYDDDKVNVYGLFPFKIFKSEGDTKGVLSSLIMPVKITMIPTSHRKESLCVDGFHTLDYVVLTFNKDDVFIESLNVIQDIENVEKLMDLFLKSKIPYGIKYDDIQSVFPICFRINGQKMGGSPMLFEAMISQFYRDPNNLDVLFRKANIKNPYNYTKVSHLDVVMDNQSNALSYQDTDQMLIRSIAKTKLKKEDNYTPVEEFMKV